MSAYMYVRSITMIREQYLSMSDSLDESRNPLANGLESIFSFVIW